VITAASLEARTSVTFQITVADNMLAATLQTIEPLTATPTSTPGAIVSMLTATRTPASSPTLTLTPTLMVAPTLVPTATPAPAPTITETRVGTLDLLGALVALSMLAGGAFVSGWASSRMVGSGVRMALFALIAGLLGYIYYSLGLPGVDAIRETIRDVGGIVFSLVGGTVGAVWGWWTSHRLRV
jgi:hypothetical protein